MTFSSLAGVRIGVLGASSPVGQRLAARLALLGAAVLAYDRQRAAAELGAEAASQRALPQARSPVPLWISAAPLWVVPNYLPALAQCGAKQLIALSSTSAVTKATSLDPTERQVAAQLSAAEAAIIQWADAHQVAWTLLRPTLIYGNGQDRNVAVIARLVRRWRFWPLVGGGCGLRQPIHVEDVVAAVIAALQTPAARRRTLTLTGGETLTYRAMVTRIAAAAGVRCHFLPLPAALLSALAPYWPQLARLLPGLPEGMIGMLLRMARDQAFSAAETAQILPQWQPRPFVLAPNDLPKP